MLDTSASLFKVGRIYKCCIARNYIEASEFAIRLVRLKATSCIPLSFPALYVQGYCPTNVYLSTIAALLDHRKRFTLGQSAQVNSVIVMTWTGASPGKMSKMFKHSSKPPRKQSQRPPVVDETQIFTFLSPSSNLDYYPRMDHPPYFNMQRHPTMLDVIKLRHLLSMKLPTEIIDMIIDQAEYWPHTTSVLDMTTRTYHDHMHYGSYRRTPKAKWNRRSTTPESRREWMEKGFVLRTPPLGIRCIQGEYSGRKGAASLSLSSFPPLRKTRKVKENEEMPDWLPPRGRNPARAIIFEISSREERLYSNAVLWHSSKTSFEASVDKIILPPKPPTSSPQPLCWTADAATTTRYLQNPFTKDTHNYSFQPRQSSSPNPTLNQAFPVLWNRTAQNRKCVVGYRFDDTTPYSAEKERFLSGEIVRGFLHSLREGDSIALWARAWEGAGPCCNVVDRVKIHVFWAV